MSASKRKAVFLDRDGVLNEDKGYVYRIEDLKVLDGVPEALRRLADRGYLLVVVTNQSGVARGMYTVADVDRFNQELERRIVAAGGPPFAAIYHCPYHPDGTVAEFARAHPDRKPGTGMIERAKRDLGLDLEASYMIGDKDSDIECGVRAGLAGSIQLLREGAPHPKALATVASLLEATDHIP